MTELVSREMYAAMVAERDALLNVAARQRQKVLDVSHRLQAARDLGKALEARLEIAEAEVTRLTASLAAAHGLQSRADRAEAALAEARAFIRGVADSVRSMSKNETFSEGFRAYSREAADAFDAFANRSAVPS